MSSSRVISHIQRVLNQCGDPVFLQPTGYEMMAEPGQMSIEVNKVLLKRLNNCFELPVPYPCSNDRPGDRYWVNRIRISTSMIDDYSKDFPYRDDELRHLIGSKANLFGCY